MTLILLIIIALLCCAMLYAHRRHQDTLTDLRDALTVLHEAWNRLADKLEGKDKP